MLIQGFKMQACDLHGFFKQNLPLSDVIVKRSCLNTKRSLAMLAAGCLYLGTATPALAQGLATPQAPPAASTTNAPLPLFLEANTLTQDNNQESYTATGDVFAHYETRSIMADQVTYDPKTGVVVATGDVSIQNSDGSTQFADKIELDDKLSAGVAHNFSSRLAGQGLLAADVAVRKSEDVNELHKTVYTACEPCKENGDTKTPTWALKADKVVENRKAKLVVYRHARLEALGVPVIYTPVLWHPDPTVDRAPGFLVPKFGVSSKRGAFIETPYLFTPTPHQDITFSPQFNQHVAPMINMRWRKRFYSGEIDVLGGVTHEQDFDQDGNTFGDETTRSYILGEGKFDISPNWYWGFGVEHATDDLLPRRYDISDLDIRRGLIQSDEQRFFSHVYLQGGDYNWHSRVLAGKNQGLRDGDNDENFANPLPMAEIFRVFPDIFGGQAEIQFNGAHLERGVGEQSTRVSAGVEWRDLHLTQQGVKIAPFVYGRADAYRLRDLTTPLSATGSENPTRLAGALGTDISMPFVKSLSNGAMIIEPMAQAIIATDEDDDAALIPNEDSQSFELDSSNLFSISRTPGYDVWEGGQRVNLGLNSRIHQGAAQFEGFLGRSWRSDGQLLSAGLEDDTSDWVGRIGASYGQYFGVQHQFRLDTDSLDDRRLDTLFWGRAGQASVWGRHVRVKSAMNINTFEELSMGVQWAPKRFWGARAEIVQDLQNDVTRRGQIGLLYRDECTELEIAYVREEQQDRTLGNSDTLSIRFALATLGEFNDE